MLLTSWLSSPYIPSSSRRISLAHATTVSSKTTVSLRYRPCPLLQMLSFQACLHPAAHTLPFPNEYAHKARLMNSTPAYFLTLIDYPSPSHIACSSSKLWTIDLYICSFLSPELSSINIIPSSDYSFPTIFPQGHFLSYIICVQYLC